jgi:hypothetical protein
MKRTRKVFLALTLFALIAVGLYAQTEADFKVEVSYDGKSVWIKGYTGKATTVNIPAKIKNLPVTSIQLYDNQIITSVIIPSGVTEISDSAFEGCTNLTSVTIPNTVTSIEGAAFSKCSKLKSITIPNSVTRIEMKAFNACSALTSVTFGGAIPSGFFAANAFNGLGDIRDKYLAAGGGAGTYTRPNGTSLVWTKGGSATAAPAAGTPELAFTLTPDKKGYIVSKQGPLSSLPVVIPATYNNLPVTNIANMAFSACALIPSVTIPASVTLIEQSAFSACVSLKSVTFEGAKTTFGWNDFPNGRDLRTKYEAGGAGTYTLSGTTWTKK